MDAANKQTSKTSLTLGTKLEERCGSLIYSYHHYNIKLGKSKLSEVNYVCKIRC